MFRPLNRAPKLPLAIVGFSRHGVLHGREQRVCSFARYTIQSKARGSGDSDFNCGDGLKAFWDISEGDCRPF